ncbi:hypothetical protein BC629DRAFT_1442198 [Irpex lacteus]|nr:hypothetical protein BC629DRAFT_1442198 [Irpex lacteus]
MHHQAELSRMQLLLSMGMLEINVCRHAGSVEVVENYQWPRLPFRMRGPGRCRDYSGKSQIQQACDGDVPSPLLKDLHDPVLLPAGWDHSVHDRTDRCIGGYNASLVLCLTSELPGPRDIGCCRSNYSDTIFEQEGKYSVHIRVLCVWCKFLNISFNVLLRSWVGMINSELPHERLLRYDFRFAQLCLLFRTVSSLYTAAYLGSRQSQCPQSRSSSRRTYFATSAYSLYLYESLIALSQEVDVIWRRKRSLMTWLYIFTRYSAVVDNILLLAPTPGGLESCRAIIYMDDILQSIQFLCFALFSTMRVYALLNGKYLVAGLVLLLNLVPFGTNMFIFVTSTVIEDSEICSLNLSVSDDVSLILSLVTRIAVIIGDILVLLVTWMRTAQAYKEAKRLDIHSPVVIMLFRDGTIYFVLPPIIVCRFILNLRHITLAEHTSISATQSASIHFVSNMGQSLRLGTSEDEHEEFDGYSTQETESHTLTEGLTPSLEESEKRAPAVSAEPYYLVMDCLGGKTCSLYEPSRFVPDSMVIFRLGVAGNRISPLLIHWLQRCINGRQGQELRMGIEYMPHKIGSFGLSYRGFDHPRRGVAWPFRRHFKGAILLVDEYTPVTIRFGSFPAQQSISFSRDRYFKFA